MSSMIGINSGGSGVDISSYGHDNSITGALENDRLLDSNGGCGDEGANNNNNNNNNNSSNNHNHYHDYDEEQHLNTSLVNKNNNNNNSNNNDNNNNNGIGLDDKGVDAELEVLMASTYHNIMQCSILFIV